MNPPSPSPPFLILLISSFSFLSPVLSAFSSTFTLVAHAPGTAVDGQPIHANGLALWIGKPTASSCVDFFLPEACPPGNRTVFGIAEKICPGDTRCGGADMDVIVPGGQLLYVDNSTALHFAIPHSAFVPAGSSEDTFTLTPDGRFGWNATDPTRATFAACPPPLKTRNQKNCKEGIYQIYARGSTNGNGRFRRGRCVNVALIATAAEEVGAWEYT